MRHAPVLDPPLKIDLKRRKIKNVIRRFISAEIDRTRICHKQKNFFKDMMRPNLSTMKTMLTYIISRVG